MMSIKWNTLAAIPTAIAIVPSYFVAGAVIAAPYQMQATGSFGQLEVENTFDGRTAEADLINADFTYYLQIVDTPSGPLAERAFLDKAAYLTGTFSQAKPDMQEDIDSRGLDARFVTDTDLIFELGYETLDDGSATDEKTTTLGFGKYLDGQTTAVLNYTKVDDFFDATILSGTYKKLTNNESAGTAFSTELVLSYIDEDVDSGYGLAGAGTYYLSDALSLNAYVDYVKVEDIDETEFGLGGGYFFADNLFANALYSQSKDDFTKSTTLALQLGARF